MCVLEMASPAINRVGSGGCPGLSLYTAPNFSARNRQSIVFASFTSACSASMIWTSRERNRSCSPLSRRSFGRMAIGVDHPIEAPKFAETTGEGLRFGKVGELAEEPQLAGAGAVN